MKWFILVVMIGSYSDGSRDTFIFTQPTLPSLQVCQDYVYKESADIRNKMKIEFQGKDIDQIFCINERKLKEFFDNAQPPGTRT